MDQQQLIDLLANPVTSGILISLIWEQTSFFQDKARPPLAKIALVLVSCILWSVVLAAMSTTGLPQTAVGWRGVVLAGVAMGFATQAFHQIVNGYFPAIGDFLFSQKTITVSASTRAAAPGGTLRMETISQQSTAPADPTPKLSDEERTAIKAAISARVAE